MGVTSNSARRATALALGSAALLLTLCAGLGSAAGHGPTALHAADAVASAPANPPAPAPNGNDEDWG